MRLLFAQLGEDIAHRLGEDVHQFVEERFVKAERAAVADGAAQDAAQDVVAVLVARLDAVGDREAQGADVIGDDAEGDVDFFLLGRRRCCRLRAACEPYFLPLSFSISSKIGRKMSVS